MILQLLQVLIKNRWTVLYCTLLAKTEGESEKEAIEEEMRADPTKEAVLRVSPVCVFCDSINTAVCVCVSFCGRKPYFQQ